VFINTTLVSHEIFVNGERTFNGSVVVDFVHDVLGGSNGVSGGTLLNVLVVRLTLEVLVTFVFTVGGLSNVRRTRILGIGDVVIT